MQILAVLGLAIALFGCSSGTTVIGLIGMSDDVFRGSAFAYRNRTGTISMTSESGTTCSGDFYYVGRDRGVGVLSCSNGDQAQIQFTALSYSSGYGYGTTGKGERVRFTFGLTEAESLPYIGSLPSRPARAPVAPPAPPPDRRLAVKATGSGISVSAKGHILTNDHVIDGCRQVRVRRAGGTIVPVTVYSRDPANDMAILIGEPSGSATAQLRDEPGLRLGEDVVVFGYPLSTTLTDTGNVTFGNVSALAGIRNDPRMIQISAPVQAGNSGGPLMDAGGNIVGVIVAKLDALGIAAKFGDVPQNVNFAIKLSLVRKFLDDNGIPYELAKFRQALAPPDVADKGRRIAVHIQCLG